MRKNSRTTRKDPLRMRRSSFIGDLGVQNSDSRAFGVPDTGASKVDTPKTSEFAFFKRLKKDAGSTFCSYQRPKEENHTDNYKSGRIAEITNKDNYSLKNPTTSPLMEGRTPVGVYSFPSPYPLRGPESSEYHYEDVFFKKRQKLCQWIAGTAVIEVDELPSKGYNMVPFFLSRLLSNNNENPCNRSSTFAQADSHFNGIHFMDQMQYLDNDSSINFSRGSNKLVTSSHGKKINYSDSDSDLHGRRLGGFKRENDFPVNRYGFLKSNHLKDLNEACNMNESSFPGDPKTLLLGWDCDGMRNSGSNKFATSSHGQMRNHSDSDSDLHGWRLGGFKGENDFPVNRYGFLETNHPKDLNGACNMNESSFLGDPKILLLGWDCDGMRNSGSNKFATSSHGEKRNYSDSDSDLLGRRLEGFEREDDFPVNRYGFPESNHLKDLNEACDMNESTFPSDPKTLLLGWDYDSMRNRRDLSATPLKADVVDQGSHILSNINELSFRREPNSPLISWGSDSLRTEGGSPYLESRTSWGDDAHHQERHLLCSPIESFGEEPKDRSYSAPLYLCSSSHSNQEELNKLPQTPSCAPFVNLEEDQSFYHAYKSSCIVLSRSNHCFMADLDFGWRPFPLIGFSGEDDSGITETIDGGWKTRVFDDNI